MQSKIVLVPTDGDAENVCAVARKDPREYEGVATCSGSVGHQATPVTSRACPRSATGLAHGLSTCAAVHAQSLICTHTACPGIV